MPTVNQVIEQIISSRNVDTGKVSGLSRQIIAKINTLVNTPLVNFEDLPGISSDGGRHLNMYLQSSCKNSLREVLRDGIADNSGLKMKINSAYRTVAQQHVLYQLYKRGSGLITLAARPGKSNHEDGMALDVDNYQAWKPYFVSNGWGWQGGNDPVHFYELSGRNDIGDIGVKAFQLLWNQFNPNDRTIVDGDFGPQTAAKMNQAPADGFVIIKIFRVGDSGEIVKRIQQALTNAGFVTSVTGSFDNATEQSVINFQKEKGLQPDGIVGPKTLTDLGITL
jgi:hypothetical protein